MVGSTPVGLSRYARSIPLSEFVSVASAIRLGLALGLISSRGLKSHAGGFGSAQTSRFSPRFASRGCPAWVWGSGHHQPLPTSTAAAINVNGGTLLWNNDHQVSNNVAVTLNGGRLDLNGCTESLGVLTLTVSSVIDPGPGGDLAFAGRGYGIPEPFCRFGTMTVRLTQARVRKRISSSLA